MAALSCFVIFEDSNAKAWQSVPQQNSSLSGWKSVETILDAISCSHLGIFWLCVISCSSEVLLCSLFQMFCYRKAAWRLQGQSWRWKQFNNTFLLSRCCHELCCVGECVTLWTDICATAFGNELLSLLVEWISGYILINHNNHAVDGGIDNNSGVWSEPFWPHNRSSTLWALTGNFLCEHSDNCRDASQAIIKLKLTKKKS